MSRKKPKDVSRHSMLKRVGVAILGHLVGMIAGVLGTIAAIAIGWVILWVAYKTGITGRRVQCTDEGMILAWVAVFLACWQWAYRAVLVDYLAPTVGPPPDMLEAPYRFFDAQGQVVLETAAHKEILEALQEGRIKATTPCAKAKCDDPEYRKPAAQALESTGVWMYFRPFFGWRLVSGSIFGLVFGVVAFVAVWIAASVQGNLSSLSGDSYVGVLFLMAVGALAASTMVGVVLGDFFASLYITRNRLPADAYQGAPLCSWAVVSMALPSAFILGLLLMLSSTRVV